MGERNQVGAGKPSEFPKAAAVLDKYAQFGGQQAEAAALRNVLAYLGYVSVQTGGPLSEAMLFGIGGGIGAAYFTFEYKSEGLKTIFLGTRINTQETKSPGFLQTICARLGLDVRVQNSGTASAAERKITKSLKDGIPSILWVNPGRRPYYPLTEMPTHYHTVVAFGLDTERDEVHLADLSDEALIISRSDLAAVRKIESAASISFRSLKVGHPAEPLELNAPIREGLTACADQMLHGWDMGGFKGNFGVQGLRKWAGLLTDSRDKKGWPQFFRSGPDLPAALWSMFDQIENRGNGVGAFRPLYAEFLDEAEEILGIGVLSEAAEMLRASGGMWSELAAAFLPEEIQALREMRVLGEQRRQLFAAEGGRALDRIRSINTRLQELRSELEREFPLDSQKRVDLLEEQQRKVQEIARLEEEAMTVIHASMA